MTIRMWTRASVTVAALGLAGVLASPPAADACARVSRRPVRMEGEEALIVWNPETRTQHFIRGASFAEVDEDFGFLVPTPTRPELGEATTDVFDRLAALYYTPRRRHSQRRRSGRRTRSAAPARVQVVERREVAGLDAAVLRASDAGALDGWLAEHDFPAGDALRGWLAPYVERGFYVTAFRYDPEGSDRSFTSRAVRMSFRTPRPFFPYSEPQSGQPTPRPFRVSVLAPTPMRALRFAGRIGLRRRLARPVVDRLLEDVARSSFGDEGAWLTVFDEPASRRGRRDLFFRADPNGSPVSSRIHTLILGSPGGPSTRAPSTSVRSPFEGL